MKVSKEELLHIANLASLNLKDKEIDTYLLHLQDILNFANVNWNITDWIDDRIEKIDRYSF